jgi:hypothetical protein
MRLTDAQLRLSVAVIADGHFPSTYAPCTVRVKKARKIERLRRLLNEAGIDFTEKNEPWEGCEGFVRFIFQAPLQGVKAFGERFYKASEDQLRIIVDEVVHWDTHVSDDPNRGFRFSSSMKISCDFIQYALCCTGIRSTITYTHRVREGRSDSHEYQVQAFSRSNLAYLCGSHPSDEGGFEKTRTAWTEPSTDGFQYCFTVPSSFLILRRNGRVFVTGNCGKTFCATATGLFHKIVYGHQVIVIMPPILIRQWGRWLAEITPAVTVTEYRGTPAQRAKLDLDVDFVLVGIQIFKRDYERFVSHFQGKPYTTIIDEATIVGNIGSDNHQKTYEFSLAHPQIVLTGTPLNSVMDVYGLMKFSAPGQYKNLKQFTNLHVEEVDFYKKPVKFQNLDLLADNLMVNSKRILFEDMYPDSEQPLFVPVYYDLDPDHYKLYRKLAEEEILKLPDGGKIDATTANKLIHALGQIIINFPHFSGDPKSVSSTVEMIDQKLQELGDKKLVVFANYRLSVAHLKERLSKYNAVTINSEVTEKQKEKNLQQFMNDPECRVIVIQFVSGGKGLDGLQRVSHHCFFAEPCQQSRDFAQCVGRLKRLGQKHRVMVMLGIANNTTQVRGFKNLLNNDGLVNQVIRNAYELRQVIFGD